MNKIPNEYLWWEMVKPLTHGVDWTYMIRRSKDVQDVVWMSYVRSI